MTKVTLIKENIPLGTNYSSRSLVAYHGGKHGSIQANMVLGMELRDLQLDPKITEETVPHWAELEHKTMWAIPIQTTTSMCQSVCVYSVFQCIDICVMVIIYFSKDIGHSQFPAVTNKAFIIFVYRSFMDMISGLLVRYCSGYS